MTKNGTASASKTLVVIDADIATDDNLALLKQKGYNYLCVSRTKLTNYTLAEDSRSDAHLFLGLLAYAVVNTIRHQLKQSGINCYWTEIVRRMSTQKLVTTQGINPLGEKIELRQCSRPTKSAIEIYQALHYKEAPFKKIKICRTQPPPA
ncbi:MAG: hypothetical protein ACI4BC_01835 [Muribaculaceae bacterium]